MQFINYSGQLLALCLAFPNWDSEITVELNLPTTVEPALSSRASHWLWAQSNRYSLEYTIDTEDAKQSTDLRLWLLRLKDETVAVPMWTDYVELPAGANAGDVGLPKTSWNPVQYGAEWIILSSDGSAFEIVVVDDVSDTTVTLANPCTLNWSPGTLMFPLLFGRIVERPQLGAETDTLITGTLKFQEDSPYARRLNPFPGIVPLVGANVPEFSTLPLLDVQPQWEKPIDFTEIDLILTQLGMGREQSAFAYAQYPRRGMKLGFYQTDRDAIARLVRLWTNRGATTRPFMAATFRGDMQLAQDLPLDDTTTLQLKTPTRYADPDYATHPGSTYIALVDPQSVEPQRIRTIDEATGIADLVGAAAAPHLANETKVSHLQFSYFADSKLSLKYLTDGQVTTTLTVIEAPNEYAAPQAELSQKGHLYVFVEYVDVPVVRGRFTSYERTLAFSGNDHQPAPMQLKNLKGDDQLGDKCEIETFDFDTIAGVVTSNPLRRILDGSLEGKLKCQVFEVNIANPDDGSAKLVISGEIVDLDTTGKQWTATISPFGNLLKRDIPHFYRQKVCNVPLFSPKCAQGRPTMKEDFKVTGTMNAFGDPAVFVEIGTADDSPADYFAGGHFETGTGETYWSRQILSSDPIPGGQRLHYLKPAPFVVEMGSEIRFWRGCNGAVETCHYVFDNLPNHRGHPNIPIANPSANIGDVQQSTGGKKG